MFRDYTKYLGKVKKFPSVILKKDRVMSEKSHHGPQITLFTNSSIKCTRSKSLDVSLMDYYMFRL